LVLLYLLRLCQNLVQHHPQELHLLLELLQLVQHQDFLFLASSAASLASSAAYLASFSASAFSAFTVLISS